MKTFNLRKWLNDKSTSSTGSVVAYSGPSPWKNVKGRTTFLEVADCHEAVRLHQCDKETTQQFIRKMKRLRNAVDKFISFLEKESANSKQ